MSGQWTGGSANRTWRRAVAEYRGRRALAEVRKVLAEFRAAHGWQPGYVWDPFQSAYVDPRGPQ